MKKRILAFVVALALVLTQLPVVHATQTGSKDAPYLIGTAEQFLEFLERANRSGDVYYELTADIDLTGAEALTGYEAQHVHLDGKGYTVRNASVTDAIFTSLTASSIRNVTFQNISVTSVDSMAGTAVLALEMDSNSVVSGCTFDGCTVAVPDGGFGGVIAAYMKGAIYNCTVTATSRVTGTNALIGGLVGENDGIIQNCISKAQFEATGSTVGGVVGQNDYVLQRCYANVALTFGQLYGDNSGRNSVVTNCLYRSNGTIVMEGGDDKDYASMDLRQLAAEMTEGTMAENDTRLIKPVNPQDYACTWSVEGEDLALSVDGKTAQIYFYVAKDLDIAKVTFSDTNVYQVEATSGRKYSVRVGSYNDSVYQRNTFSVTYSNENPFIVVNNFVYEPNHSSVKEMPNRMDGVEGTYSDVFLSAVHDVYAYEIKSSATHGLYPYCTTLSVTNNTAEDELVPYHFQGSGTEEDPYQIWMILELQCLAYHVNNGNAWNGLRFNEAHYKLMIDLNIPYAELVPIGTFSSDYSTAFRGTFDGSGHKILYPNLDSSSSYVGLFGVVAGIKSEDGLTTRNAVIKNLNMLRISYTPSGNEKGNMVGGIAGMAVDTTFDGCVVQGAISGRTQLGAIVGYAYNSNLYNCGSNVAITTNNIHAWAGGLVGYAAHSDIRNSYSVSTFTNNQVALPEYLNIGAIAGYVVDSTFDHCFYVARSEINSSKDYTGVTQTTMTTLKSDDMLHALRDYSDAYGFESLWASGAMFPSNNSLPGISRTANYSYRVDCVPTSAGSVSAELRRYQPNNTVRVTGTGVKGLKLYGNDGTLLDIPVTVSTSGSTTTLTFTMPAQAVRIVPDFGTAALQGSGTEADPYLIGSVTDFETMAALVQSQSSFRTAHYAMDADVDFGGNAITPIGNQGAMFQGRFNGRGHTISNGVISSSDSGLFGYVYGASIINLQVKNFSVTGFSSGLLIGTAVGVNLVQNITVEGVNVTTRGALVVGYNMGTLTVGNSIFRDSTFNMEGGGGYIAAECEKPLYLINNVFLNLTPGQLISYIPGEQVTMTHNYFCETNFYETDLYSVREVTRDTLCSVETISKLSEYSLNHFNETIAYMWGQRSDGTPTLCYDNHVDAMNVITYASVFTSSDLKLLVPESMVTAAKVGQLVELKYVANVSPANIVIKTGSTQIDYDLNGQPDEDGYGRIRFIMPAGPVTITNNGQPIRMMYLFGEGTQTAPYEIGTPYELLLMQDVINGDVTQYVPGTEYVSYNQAYFILTDDIDMAEHTWNGIGTGTYLFAGTFDGQGKTIYNLHQGTSTADGSRNGLFLKLAAGSTVTRLTINNADVYGSDTAMEGVGAIAKQNYGTISMCAVVASTVQTKDSNYLGAIAGLNGAGGTIINCYAFLTKLVRIDSPAKAIGGITQQNNGTVQYCHTYRCTFTGGSADTDGILAGGNAPSYCYYYTTSSISNNYNNARTDADFNGGFVCYMLNSDQELPVWGQFLGSQLYPVFGGNRVYYGYENCADDAVAHYSNSVLYEVKPDHQFEDGKCNICGKICPHTNMTAVPSSATCTEPGRIVYKCWDCGYSYSVENELEPALGHNFVDHVCTRCGALEPLPIIDPVCATLSLEEDVHYNIYFTIENFEASLENMGLLIWNSGAPTDVTMESAELIIPGVLWDAEGSRYKATTDGVAAKNMADLKYIVVYAQLEDGTYLYSRVVEYSARKYAMSCLDPDSTANDETRAVCVALMNYGAEAQAYFASISDYTYETLMNAEISADDQLRVDPYHASMVNTRVIVDDSKAGVFAATGGFEKRTATATLGSTFGINVYITPRALPEHATVYYWTAADYAAAEELTAQNATGAVTMTQEADARYKGRFCGIAAKEFDETVYIVCVYESNGVTYSTGVISYSIGTYCQSCIERDNAESNLAKSAAVYGYYAKLALIKQ